MTLLREAYEHKMANNKSREITLEGFGFSDEEKEFNSIADDIVSESLRLLRRYGHRIPSDPEYSRFDKIINRVFGERKFGGMKATDYFGSTSIIQGFDIEDDSIEVQLSCSTTSPEKTHLVTLSIEGIEEDFSFSVKDNGQSYSFYYDYDLIDLKQTQEVIHLLRANLEPSIPHR